MTSTVTINLIDGTEINDCDLNHMHICRDRAQGLLHYIASQRGIPVDKLTTAQMLAGLAAIDLAAIKHNEAGMDWTNEANFNECFASALNELQSFMIVGSGWEPDLVATVE